MVGKGDQGGGVAAVPIDAPDDVVDVVPAPDGGKDGKGEAVEPTLWYPVEGQGDALAGASWTAPCPWSFEQLRLLPLRQNNGDLRQAARLVLRELGHRDVLVCPCPASGPG
ncbi:hypothetical protein DXN64_25030 [Salmonella enterica]|uniref:Uncharacterized protein n=1 Tax=Escherichia coli TaxID=562 RepID=A0A377E9K1_ECOLX|nr:hypothetical protein [Salmonella enterica]EBH8760542.1 hypothetical protein [Salmonella enterica subsp. enterica serovar Larochelle]EBS6398914.1 hypothetical protein [Salmonella enterica subsp. enterica serovar Emek]EBV3172132.1 hypothetical protein [Salmonella enterica subsp. enterica serovar Rissen]EBW1866801.1 hypothetical protein [Salmonella enterica subsp. enterica serovar Mbandaka]EBZ4757070.1 hypothetical protein [Salmonella enterica subsp. enterica serovar Typhimurium]MHX18997.1 hy